MQPATERRFAHIPAGAGETYAVIGELITFKVTQADTSGTCTVVELMGQPGGGPPLHTHPSAETFSIVEGGFEFTGLRDGAPYVIHANPGDTVYIPAGEPHTYKVVGESPGKTLLMFTPGGEMERFFAEAGTRVTGAAPAPSAPPDFPAMIALAEKHGMVFLPPPAP